MSKEVDNKHFIVEIPDFNPISQHYERTKWWKEQKRRCIEGYWYEGKWMPGSLYFYVNFCFIEVKAEKGVKGKSLSKPWLRDIEWEKAYVKMEAMGFSHFEGDNKYTCHEWYGPKKELALDMGWITQEELDSKTYISAREYLPKIHKKNLGKARFKNVARNIIDLESRDSGKSYTAAGEIVHDFLFDGALDYDLYLEAREKGEPMKTQIMVGAIDAFYSGDLLKKVTTMFKYVPGGMEYNDEYYPSPLMVNTKGSLRPGSSLVSIESGSMIHHRTFRDNPLAGAGTRCSKVYIEEVGFMNNIEETLGGLKDVVSADGEQYGVIHMFGTGGLVKGAAATFTQDIFSNPEEFNCLAFDDIWEGRGKIGFFMPAIKVLNQFKEGPNLVTNEEKASRWLEKYRKEVESNKVLYASRVINRPIKPSEIFLTTDGAFFQVILMELKNTKDNLYADERLIKSFWHGFCETTENGDVIWKNTKDKPIIQYPYKATKMGQGCIEIYEMPVKNFTGDVPGGIYIAGCDPVDDDGFAGSLQCTFIMNRLTNRIVAEYTARHETADQYYEHLRKLLLFYNATCNYENNKKGLYQYFHNNNSLFLLSETPKILRDQSMVKTSGTGNKGFGTPANQYVNRWARDVSKTWLMEQSTSHEELFNVNHLKSIGLIEELIRWNEDGNFDRVSALGMLMIYKEQKHKQTATITEKKDSIFSKWTKQIDKVNSKRSIGMEFQTLNNRK